MWKKQGSDGSWVDFSSDINDRIEDAFEKASTFMQINSESFLFTEMLFVDSNGAECKMTRTHTTTSDIPWGFEATHGEYCPCDPHMSALLTIARRNKLEEIVIHDYRGGSSKRVFLDSIPMVQKNEDTLMTRILNPAPVESYTKAKRPFPDYSDAPDNLKCPLTYELMHDPVIAADGHTYERAAIEEHFARCKVKSPMKNVILKTPVVYSNLDKRSIINEWLDANHPEWKANKRQKKVSKKQAGVKAVSKGKKSA